MDYVHRSCVSFRGGVDPSDHLQGQGPPGLVFFQEFQKIVPWYYIYSENDWTSNEIAVSWLEHVYLPQTILLLLLFIKLSSGPPASCTPPQPTLTSRQIAEGAQYSGIRMPL